jgi:hypothetical protein
MSATSADVTLNELEELERDAEEWWRLEHQDDEY